MSDQGAACFWPNFAAAVEDRLREGRVQYGDRSFNRPPDALVGEIEQELLDVCAWAFILWIRLRNLHGVLGEPPDYLEGGQQDRK